MTIAGWLFPRILVYAKESAKPNIQIGEKYILIWLSETKIWKKKWNNKLNFKKMEEKSQVSLPIKLKPFTPFSELVV